MKQYTYKIQWLFNLGDIKNIRKIIKILGVRSLDKIIFRDSDLKIVDVYNGFIQYPYGLAESQTMKYINKTIKYYNHIQYVELLRR